MSNLQSFADLGLSEQTLRALKEKGFEEPTKIQAACIPLLLKDQVDVIGQAQTGTGKTAAFGLPILEIVDPKKTEVQALILAPTRELAVQDAEEISSLKGDRHLEIAAIYGGASMELQLRKLRKGVHVVVGTPGRVLDHLRRGTLKLDSLKFMVLDEADEMLDMGFIDDIEEVLKQTPENKRMLCFSATMPAPIMHLAEKFMKNPQVVRVKLETVTPVLTDQIYFEVRESEKFEALTRIIDMEDNFYGIVFCRTKVQCDEVGHKLQDRGYDAEALHGDLSQKQREQILRRMKEKLLSIIVATDVAARGIDIQDLTHVINFSLPEEPEAYIHRIGRTGRAGKTGTAITFVTPREFRKLSFIQKVAKTEIRKAEIPDASDIVSAKRTKILSQMTGILTEQKDNSVYATIAEQMLDGRDAKSVVEAMLDYCYKDALDESKYRNLDDGSSSRSSSSRRERESFSDESSGYTRLFIARGKKDGLDKQSLTDYLIEQVGAKDEDFRDVAVQDEFSFVSAPLLVAERILKAFEVTNPAEKPIITRAKPDNPNGRNLSSRNRGGRSRRREEDDYRPRSSGSREDHRPMRRSGRSNSESSTRRRYHD
ncbi:MAG: DEAD/DEAH box helicase [Sphaerochaetaceae bacterium]